MKAYESLAIKMGYVPSGAGLKKETNETTHWITLFDDCLQMYGYESGWDEYESCYDTGIIKITSNQLETLIEIFTTNHN